MSNSYSVTIFLSRLLDQYPHFRSLISDELYQGKLKWQLGEVWVWTQLLIDRDQRQDYLKIVKFMEDGWENGNPEVRDAIEFGWLVRLEHDEWSWDYLSTKLQQRSEIVLKQLNRKQPMPEPTGATGLLITIFYWLHVIVIIVVLAGSMIGTYALVEPIRLWLYTLPQNSIVLPYSPAGDWLVIVAMIGVVPLAGLLLLPIYLLIPQVFRRQFDRKALSVGMARDIEVYEHAAAKYAKAAEQAMSTDPVLQVQAKRHYEKYWWLFLVPIVLVGPFLYWGTLSNYWWWSQSGVHVRGMWQIEEKTLPWQAEMYLQGSYEVVKNNFYPELKLYMGSSRQVVVWDHNRNFNFETNKLLKIIEELKRYGVKVTWQPLTVSGTVDDKLWFMYYQLSDNISEEEAKRRLKLTDPSNIPSTGAIFRNGHWIEKDSAEYYFDLSSQAYKANQLNEAKNWLTQSLAVDSQYVPSLAAQAMIMAIHDGQLAAAEQQLLLALKLNPDWLDTYLYLATVKKLQKNPVSAKTYLQLAKDRFSQPNELKLIQQTEDLIN